MLKENNYHRLEKLNKEEALRRNTKKERRRVNQIPLKPENQRFTDEQWQAIFDQGDNLLVSASAGSGKTTVLYESHREIEDGGQSGRVADSDVYRGGRTRNEGTNPGGTTRSSQYRK